MRCGDPIWNLARAGRRGAIGAGGGPAERFSVVAAAAAGIDGDDDDDSGRAETSIGSGDGLGEDIVGRSIDLIGVKSGG